MSRTCGVYALTDPNTLDVRYVGQSIDVHQRFFGHVNAKLKTPVSVWIQELKSNKQKPLLVILEVCVFDQLDVVEQKWIGIHEGPLLLNLGWSARGGWKLSPDGRRRVRTAKLGVAVSVETREKISRANKGRVPSEATRTLWREQRKGKKKKPFSLEHKRKLAEVARIRRASGWVPRGGVKNAGRLVPVEERIRNSLAQKGHKCYCHGSLRGHPPTHLSPKRLVLLGTLLHQIQQLIRRA